MSDQQQPTVDRPTEADMQVDLRDCLANFGEWFPAVRGPISQAAVERTKAILRRALYAEAILNAPRVMLFADGREPTRNERHLMNLLSWREKEAADAKAALAEHHKRMEQVLARLNEATDRVETRVKELEAENARLQSIVDALPGLATAQARVARKHLDDEYVIAELEKAAEEDGRYIDELLGEIDELEGRQ